MARAAIDVAATIGYDAMTITDIADAAGVVRRTFSRYFADKQAAFEVGYLQIAEELREAVQTAYDSASTPPDRARAFLQALADFLAEDPARAEVLLIEGHAAGPGAAAVRDETMRRGVQLVLHNTADLPQPEGNARVLAETVVGGIYQVIYTRTLRGEVRDLPALVPEWTAVAMMPYVAIVEQTAAAGRASSGKPPAAE